MPSNKHQKESASAPLSHPFLALPQVDPNLPGRVSEKMIRVGASGQTVNTLPIFTEGKGHNKDSQMSPRLINILLWRAPISSDKLAPSNCKDNFHLSSANTCLWFLNCRSALRTSLTFIQPRMIRTHPAFILQQTSRQQNMVKVRHS